MVANYFLGAVILMLTSDITYSAGLCLCPEPLDIYTTDCCREPIWKVRTTQKSVWDMWWTRRPIWNAWMTTKMPVWKRSTTWKYFRDMWTTRKQITKPTTLSPYLNNDTRTGRTFWDLWSTRKLTTTPTAPSLYHTYWSTTPSSSTKDVAIIIGASVGSVTCLGFLCCFIAACVRMKRVQRRPIQVHQTQPEPRRPGIPCIVIRRILVRQCRGSADTENLISNPQVNSNIPQTTGYEYNPGPITPVAPPPYYQASPYEPPPPYSEHI